MSRESQKVAKNYGDYPAPVVFGKEKGIERAISERFLQGSFPEGLPKFSSMSYSPKPRSNSTRYQANTPVNLFDPILGFQKDSKEEAATASIQNQKPAGDDLYSKNTKCDPGPSRPEIKSGNGGRNFPSSSSRLTFQNNSVSRGKMSERESLSELRQTRSSSSVCEITEAPPSSNRSFDTKFLESKASRLGQAAALLFDQQQSGDRDLLFKTENEAMEALRKENSRKREISLATTDAISSHPHFQKIQELGIEAILSELRKKDTETQKAAAHKLRMLARDSDENRGLIADAGGIPALASVVKRGAPEAVDEAVTALLNLSLQGNNKRIMAALGVIEPLIEAMISGSWVTRENSAAALFSLSMVDDNKIMIGALGGVPPLIQVLKHGSEQGKRDACKALFNLSILGTNKIRMIEEGAVQTLIEFMQEPETGMAEKAVSVLANLSTVEEGREAIADDDDGIPLLVEVVEEGTSRGKENAAAALWQLAKSSTIYRKMILQEVVIPPLVALSQTGTTRAKEKASLLLKNFRDPQ